jgi:uncharacterized membrane protein
MLLKRALPKAADVTKSAKGAVSEGVSDAAEKTVDKAGGAGGVAKEAGKKLLPGGGGDGGDDQKGKKGTPGVGKGRRMPIQQEADIAVPLSTAYNQWTQFEDWAEFMHRIDRVTQEDDCTVSFRAKLWGMSKEFVAEIVEQRPDERIQWNVSQGVSHTGVVTFHELAPSLTRVQVSLDVEPGSLIEKAARGMRHTKRAVRADLSRFKAFIEMQEVESGAWRGVIHDGEIVEEHDPKYDRSREYAEVDDIHERDSSHSPQKKSGSKSSRSRKSGSGRKSGSSRTRKSGSSRTRKSGSSGSKSRSKSSSGSRTRSSSKSSRSRSGGRSKSGSSRSRSSGGRSSSSSRKRSSSRR